eukprot:6193992-Pleurochrysis_carterae.AAC.1
MYRSIGVPLVWRYLWDAVKERVLVQYKFSLADKATPEQDEWGPWEYVMIDRLNESTGTVEKVQQLGTHKGYRLVAICTLTRLARGYARPHTPPLSGPFTVKRSTSTGVEVMRGYPDVNNYPGVEDWLPMEKWSMQKVFDDIYQWDYVDKSKAAMYQCQWEALCAWHTAYSASDSITIGMLHDVHVADGLKIGGCPAVSWGEMWSLLDSRASGYRDGVAAISASEPSTSGAPPREESGHSSTVPLRSQLRGNALRQALSTAAR